MKIVYVLNSFNDGGAELGLLSLVENGFFNGHELAIYALAKARGTVCERLRKAAGADRVHWLSEAPVLQDRMLPIAAARLARVLKAEQPDFVILSLPQANLVGRLASIAVPHATLISFVHSLEYTRRVAHWLMAATAPLVDMVFYDHPATWRSIRPVFRRIPESAAYYVSLMFIDALDVPVRIPTGRRRLVTTMRLEPVKNHLELFHAVGLLLERGYDLDLTVVGEGTMRVPLERLIRELKLADRVRMVGFAENPMELLRSYDTYVLSSFREGLCRSVIEAMAAGLVVVSTDVGGIREYGVDGENMIKSSGSTRDDLAAALAAALDLGPGARHLQEGALRTVQQEFSPAVVRQYWTAAMDALERGRQPQAAM
ncbi:MAG: glycosyl transferase family 1 [Frankiales bacterium]|nr:glycosyl transferase family 1 [Frankiales bacterium]